jgi:hypothetical protein
MRSVSVAAIEKSGVQASDSIGCTVCRLACNALPEPAKTLCLIACDRIAC